MVTLDANKYRRINYQLIKEFLDNKDPDERYNLIGHMALYTYVPIIVVACFYGEMYGFDERLNDFINRLMKFYLVDEVVNVIYD